MALNSLGSEPLDSEITDLRDGTLIFLSDQTNGQGEALIHEVLANTNAVYNHPRHSRPVVEDLLARSRYIPDDATPTIFTNGDELTIDCHPYDVAVYDAFQAGSKINQSDGVLTALRQNLIEGEAIGIIRDARTALADRTALTDFADVTITLSEHRTDGNIEYRFAIVKNRYSGPSNMEQPLEFGTPIEIDTTRQIS